MKRSSLATTALLALGLSGGPACNCGSPSVGKETGSTTGTIGLSGTSSSGGGTTSGASSSGGPGDGGCGLRTCASAKANCGPIGDGCNDILQCGSCTAPETCGGGGVPSVCGGDAGLCPARSCASEHATCGPLSDGCGNLLQCGECDAGSCGGGGKSNVCGVSTDTDGGDLEPDGGCKPQTCTQQGLSCGPAGDGCGNTIQCGGCDAGSCGGGGVLGICGGGTGVCTARTCLSEHATCGPLGDGCGNLLQCGECDAGGACGGGGTPNVCGFSTDIDGGDLEPDGGCRPLTCALQGVQCGPAGDGCGDVIDCGGCDAGTCGGAGVLGVCGVGCTSATCTSLNIGCGPAGDGCGNVLDCGGCDAGGTCGGAGVLGQCGTPPPCIRLDCADAGASCGSMGDGCGGQLTCGTCAAPDICGGGGVPFVCGDGSSADGGACLAPLASCNTAAGPICTDIQTDPNNCGQCGNLCGTGLVCVAGVCTAQCSGSVSCNADAGEICVLDHCANACDVQLTGTSSLGCEFWPLHLWNTEDGSTCGKTEDQPCFRGPLGVVASNSSSTSSAVVTLEDEDGGGIIDTVTIPAGSAYTFSVPNGEDALNQTMSGNSLHLRSTVPIAAYEFNPVDATAAYSSGASLLLPTHTLAQNYFVLSYTYTNIPTLTPALGQGYLAVVGTQPNTSVTVQVPVLTLESADTTIPALNPGGTYTVTLGPGQAIEIAQALDGGDISGAQISANKPVAAYGGSGATTVPDTALGGDHFEVQLIPTAAWGTAYECEKYQPRSGNDVDHWRIAAGVADTVVTLSDPAIATIPTLGPGDMFEFDTAESFDLSATQPVLVAHYLEAWGNLTGKINKTTFPNPTTNPCPGVNGANSAECIGDANMALVVPTAQYLESYTFFTPTEFAYNYVDVLAPIMSTVTLDGTTTATLTAIGSGAYGLDRMPVTSGNHTIIGDQPFGIGIYGYDYAISYSYAGGLNLANIGFTGNPATCTPLTCAKQNLNCGPAGDGCGNLIDGGCGTCTPPQTCGGGGPGICGSSCVPETCVGLKLTCGPAGDGCGNLIDGGCGTCNPPATCGGGGTPGACGEITCQPRTCLSLGYTCGPAGDGCGNLIDGGCGICMPPDTCGGGGTPGACGQNVQCTPLSCAQQGLSCGPTGDGCGNEIQCGGCDAGTCGGGGVAGVCGFLGCTPRTCASTGDTCGPVANGCGGLIDGGCGSCTLPETCGGGGTPGACGSNVQCTPQSCAQQGLSCGEAGDGCGNVIQCGGCDAGTCGGGGVAGACGGSSCKPLTCAELGYDCGPAGDGCGGLIQCGVCDAGTCGGGFQANVCGSPIFQ